MMATETQTMSPTCSTPAHKFPRYRSVRETDAEPHIPSPPSPKQTSPKAPNESILRSMSRYRKRPSKPDPLSSPPLPQPNRKPARTPQSHPASLAALTGEPQCEDQEPPSDPTGEAPTQPRLLSSPESITSPTKRSGPRSTRTPRPVRPIEEPLQTRQMSWEAVCAARAKAQAPNTTPRQEVREILAAEDERVQPLQIQQRAEMEGQSGQRRAVATGEQRRREEPEAEQQERHEVQHKRREPERRDMRKQQAAARHEAGEISAAAKKEPVNSRRGVSIRQRLGSLTKTKSFELLGSDKTPKLPDKKNLWASRPTLGKVSTAGPSSAVSTSRSAPPTDIGLTKWVDVPVSRTPPGQSFDVQAAHWPDAPVSRPTARDDTPVTLPQHDAPISAVNAGDREVVIHCGGSSMTLPVTPSTTPQDLINLASTALSKGADPNTLDLVESFSPLGLERPLRIYEHVRDVMNSWDNDAQNYFIVLPAMNDRRNSRLDSRNAPKQQPGDTSVYMYHSQRPGTWEKRWITLRSDGQVTVAKRQGQETTNICHLTDFDVYTPTSRQQKKRIKPPKKICIAIKSQQKSNMFLNGANFVHFFATNDEIVAAEWYRAVQGWRSWYLVNVLGEGQGSRRISATDEAVRPTTTRTRTRAATGPAPRQSGSLEPSLDSSPGQHSFKNSGAAARATQSAGASHARNISSRGRAPPPSAFLNQLSKDVESGPAATNRKRSQSLVKSPAPDKLETSTFSPTGLLGRTYSQRQRAQREREMHGTRNDSPQSVDPGAALTRKSSTKSVRQMPKPLIDLTPQYQEPPQHVRKGKGVAPEPGKQLVDVATGPDLPSGAILVPSATTWRKPQAHSPPRDNSPRPTRPSVGVGGSQTSIDGGRPRPWMDAGQPQSDDDEPFREGGLLARTASKRSRRGGGAGHGVRTGDRNAIGKPMVDLQMKSQFVDGSLLRQVEAHTGTDGPIVDREKRHEERVRTGERT